MLICLKFTGERLVPQDNQCGPETEIYKEHIRRYAFAKRFIKSNDTVLDLACGVGYGCKLLNDHIDCTIYGCDISLETIKYAKENYSAKKINFQTMDASSLSFPNNFFNCIICFETLEHLKNYGNTLDEFFRVLKNHGLLIISTPNKEISLKSKNQNEYHINEFTHDEFVKTLSHNFQKISLFSQKLMIDPDLKEKTLKSSLSFALKISKYDKLNFRRIFFKDGTGRRLNQSVSKSYRSPDIIPYLSEHNPQNFIAVCTKI